MNRYWTRDDGRAGHARWATSHAGEVWASHDSKQGRLHVQWGRAPQLSVTLGDVEYAHPGEERAIQPAGEALLVQEPYVVLPREISSPVGLRLVVGVWVDPSAMMIDLRLETIAPLERVSVSASIEIAGGSAWPMAGRSPDRQVYDRHEARHWVVQEGTSPAGLLVSDLGEGGFAVARPDGARWELTLFEQPLEKGVILVGRIGWVAAEPNESGEALARRGEEGLSRPTFL